MTDNTSMQQSISLKPQDVALLAKIIVRRSEEWRQVDVAIELGLSQGEVAKSLSRLNKSGLILGKRVNRSSSVEFILHAVKYMFPAEIGALTVGLPTAFSSPAHSKMVVQNGDDVFVWPSLDGKKRGQMIKPFYPKLAEAALRDSDFYDFMSALEILRIGRARERKFAENYLAKRIGHA